MAEVHALPAPDLGDGALALERGAIEGLHALVRRRRDHLHERLTDDVLGALIAERAPVCHDEAQIAIEQHHGDVGEIMDQEPVLLRGAPPLLELAREALGGEAQLLGALLDAPLQLDERELEGHVLGAERGRAVRELSLIGLGREPMPARIARIVWRARVLGRRSGRPRRERGAISLERLAEELRVVRERGLVVRVEVPRLDIEHREHADETPASAANGGHRGAAHAGRDPRELTGA